MAIDQSEIPRAEKTRSRPFDIKLLEHYIIEHGFTSEPHRHDCYFILLVTKGSGMYTIDFVTNKIKPYTAFLLTPGQVQSWKFSHDVEGFMILFTMAFYKIDKRERHLNTTPAFQLFNGQYCLSLDRERERNLVVMLEEMILENSHNEYGRDALLRSCLDILLIRLSRYYQRTRVQQAPSIHTFKIRQLEFLVEKHYLSLKLPYEYARIMNITPKHLNHICKRSLNKTVSNLIHERLMLEARRLLAHSDLSVTQISDILGFNDKSHFIRFFKKRLSTTPEQFRKTQHVVLHNA